MAYTLDSLSALRREFLRQADLSPADDGLTEHDAERDEAIHRLLQQGLWEAQYFLLQTDPWRWAKTSATLSWSGSEAEDGGRYTDLPADFLRLAGDERLSALRQPDGVRWGRLVTPNDKHRIGNFYYIRDGQLWLNKGAAPPSDLVMDYHHRHALLTDDAGETENDIDFPLEDRHLIVAFALWCAAYEPVSLLPGGALPKIERYLSFAKERAASRGRRTKEPHKIKPPRVLGTHWFIQ